MVNKRYKLSQLFAFFSLKWRLWTKKGSQIQTRAAKKVPRRAHISWRGPIWEQCNVKPFWVSLCSSAACFPDSGRKEKLGQDGGARPNFLQGKICHCFVNFLWFFCNFFALGTWPTPNSGLSMSKQITCPLPSTDNSYFPKSISKMWGQKGSNEENENFQRSISQLFWCSESKKLRGQSWNVW